MKRSRRAIVGLVALVFGTSCSGDEATPLDRRVEFAALLANGTLVGYTADGDEVARVRIGRRLQSPVSGQYIGFVPAARGGEIVVIDAAANPNELVFVGSESWKIERRAALPRRSLFRNVIVGREAKAFSSQATRLPNSSHRLARSPTQRRSRCSMARAESSLRRRFAVRD